MSILKKAITFNDLVVKYLKRKTTNKLLYPYLYFSIGIDLVHSTTKEKITPSEYFDLHYYELDKFRRKNIVTRMERDEIVKKSNKKEDIPKLENKKQFLNNYKPYLNREFLILDKTSFDDFKAFYLKHKGFVAKNSDSGQGRDVQIITEVEDLYEEYKRLKSESFDLIEEIATTHEELQKINPIGLPSIRIMTFIDKKGVPHLIASSITFSTYNPVINTNVGGFKAIVNSENGEIVSDAISKNNDKIKEHPVSNIPIKGYKIPEWDKLRKMLLNAAKVIPTVRYVGWDCSISDKGPLLIEANAKRPGINSMQKYGFNRVDEKYAKFNLIRSEIMYK